jgi:hypothetical protein
MRLSSSATDMNLVSPDPKNEIVHSIDLNNKKATAVDQVIELSVTTS